MFGTRLHGDEGLPPEVQPRQASDLHRVLRGVPSDCVDLLDKMFRFLPEDRLSLDESLTTPLPPGAPEGKLERDGLRRASPRAL